MISASLSSAPSTIEDNSNQRVVIIGAGPAGLSAAVRLAEQGRKVTLLESSGRVGGMCASMQLWDQIVDLGPHRFFSLSPKVNDFWLSHTQGQAKKVERITRIYYNQKFFSYPLKPIEAFFNLGPWASFRCLASFLKEKVIPSHDHLSTFEAWVTRHFGKKLYEIFFKSYSEKLWGLSCDRIDADFAAQRIKKFSLGQAVLSAFKLNRTSHKTLVDEFDFPTKGTGQVYENMAVSFTKLGGQIEFHRKVERFEIQQGKIHQVVCADGSSYTADEVISTMPLTHLVNGLGESNPKVEAALEALKFRNTILVYLELDTMNCFPDQWIYVHSKEVSFGRVTNFRNWVPELYGKQNTSIVCLEFWCNHDDPLWQASHEELAQKASLEAKKIRVFQHLQILRTHVVKIPRSYPIYEMGYQAHVNTLRDHLQRFTNLHVIGRYGSFKYNNQDHSVMMGLMAAENLTQGTHHDLWSVNTDYDQYQEA